MASNGIDGNSVTPGHGRLEGKVAIITGGGQGISETVAKRFALEGASIVVADFNKELGNAVALELNHNSTEAEFVQADVTKR